MTLIKSVLTFIPIYFFSFFRVLNRVVDKLVSIQCRFLWGGGIEQKKIAWIKWDTMCLPKEKKGIRHKRHQHLQSNTAWKMEMGSISAPRGTMGQDIGFKIWWLEVHG